MKKIVVALLFTLLIVASVYLDQAIYLFVNADPHQPWLRTLKDITDLGKGFHYFWTTLALGIGCALIARRTHRAHLKSRLISWSRFFNFAFLNFCVSGLLVLVFKMLIGRARPSAHSVFTNTVFQPLNFDHVYQSFPSGHTQVVFTFAFLVGLRSRLLLVPALAFASVIAASRIAGNDHFLSDIWGGILFAWIGLELSKKLALSLPAPWDGRIDFRDF